MTDEDSINMVSFLGQTMMTPDMQGIIMAIGKARSVHDKSGPEAAFFKVLFILFVSVRLQPQLLCQPPFCGFNETV